MLNDIFDIDEFKTIFLMGFRMFLRVDFRKEHVVRTCPKFVIAVKRAIKYELFVGFGMVRDIFEDVEPAFIMLVNSVKLETIHALIPKVFPVYNKSREQSESGRVAFGRVFRDE